MARSPRVRIPAGRPRRRPATTPISSSPISTSPSVRSPPSSSAAAPGRRGTAGPPVACFPARPAGRKPAYLGLTRPGPARPAPASARDRAVPDPTTVNTGRRSRSAHGSAAMSWDPRRGLKPAGDEPRARGVGASRPSGSMGHLVLRRGFRDLVAAATPVTAQLGSSSAARVRRRRPDSPGSNDSWRLASSCRASCPATWSLSRWPSHRTPVVASTIRGCARSSGRSAGRGRRREVAALVIALTASTRPRSA